MCRDGGELGGFHESDHAVLRSFGAVGAPERDGRGAEDPEALQQRLIGCVVGRDIGLQQHGTCERPLHGFVGEGITLHLFAGDAPIGIEIEHHRTTGRCRSGKFTVEPVRAFDGAELEALHFARELRDRRQRVASAERCADQHREPPSPEQQPGDARSPTSGCGGAQSPEHAGTDQRRHRPQRERRALGQDARQHPHRHRQQQHTKDLLDRFHPRAGGRQQAARRSADREQRYAHAERHREEHAAAAHQVTGLRDHRECGEQRRCHTSRDDQGRQRAHRRDAAERTGTTAVAGIGEAALQRCGHLYGEEAEHRERHHHEEEREQHDDPRFLEQRLHLLAGRRRGDAGERVGDRHAEHIGE